MSSSCLMERPLQSAYKGEQTTEYVRINEENLCGFL